MRLCEKSLGSVINLKQESQGTLTEYNVELAGHNTKQLFGKYISIFIIIRVLRRKYHF